MSGKQREDDLKSLERMKCRQENEANLNWTRNSYFLVVLSLLTLAYSQKPFDDALQLLIYQIIIPLLAIGLCVIWSFIQYRSSSYIKYYKDTAQDLAKKNNVPELYPPKIKGPEMRKLVYGLPAGFMAMSIAFIIIQVCFYLGYLSA
jgi:hypothetical protein